MEEFVVYVLFLESYNKIYIGYSSEIINRIKAHNFFENKGYTSKFRPWKLMQIEFYDNKSIALKREKEIKSCKGREWIHKTIIKI